MTDDDLLTRADKFIRAGTATDLEIDLVAALRAAKAENARLRQRLLYFENPPADSAPPTTREDENG